MCRWEFGLTEKNRPGEVFPVAEDERGTYIMNSRDLCLMDCLPQLMEAGVSSLKIEGRMKSVHYVASVVSAYRKAIDLCWQDPEHFTVPQSLRAELDKVSHRPYTTGSSSGRPVRKTRCTPPVPMNRPRISWAWSGASMPLPAGCRWNSGTM